MSMAVTVKVWTPTIDVSKGVPFGAGALQLRMPASASAQPKSEANVVPAA